MPNAWPTSSLRSQKSEGSINRYYRVARKEFDRSVGWQHPPHNFPLLKYFLSTLWQCRSVDFILCQFLTFVWEATWFLHASKLCAFPKLNYPAIQPVSRLTVTGKPLTKLKKKDYNYLIHQTNVLNRRVIHSKKITRWNSTMVAKSGAPSAIASQ